MNERDFLTRIANSGGTAYLVGGSVRDMLLHRSSADRDYVVCGLSAEDFVSLFPTTLCLSRVFPVFCVVVDDLFCQVALARTERKTGSGYLGFEVSCTADITIEQDLSRRDTTMNSIAWNPLTDELTDPFKGAEDIAAKVVRAVSPRFSEDPVRALRAARQAAQLGFSIEKETLALMGACREELRNEQQGMIIGETEKALTAPRPSLYFRALDDAGLLEVLFPWIYRLKGKIRTFSSHSDGDAFEHTMAVLDYVSMRTDRAEVKFAALVHDIGKSETPAERLPRHSVHDERGIAVLKEMREALGFRSVWYRCALFVIMRHNLPAKMSDAGKIVDLLAAIRKNPIGYDGFSLIVTADNYGEEPEFVLRLNDYLRVIEEADCETFPPHLEGADRSAWRRQREISAVGNFLAGKES